jgi:enoyl-CoA hydratase/carnithine racemase
MTLTIRNHAVESYGWQQWHISCPDRINALGTTMAAVLSDALELVRSNRPDGIRAIVITAEPVIRGDRCFWIAGGDLKELSQLTSRADALRYAQLMRLFCESLEFLPIPVISVVDGAAIGGGAELALAADIRFATIRSSFEFKQLKMGLTTGYGGASRLVNLIGKSRAQSLLYFGESITAEESLRQGLVHRLVQTSDPKTIGAMILPILKIEPVAMSAQKKMLRMSTDHPSADHSWADDLFASIWMNETHAANLRNFGAK